MRHKTKQQIVSFFFVRFDDIYSQSSEVIIRSLACQTLARASVDDSLLELMEKSDALMFDSESLLDVLSHQIALLDDYFLVIDGLDECNMSNRRSILKFLTLLRQKCLKGRVKVIVSARDSVTNQVHSFFPSFSRVIVGSDETNRDLTLFAHEILAEKQRGDWSVGDPKLIDTILHSIGLGGEGMYVHSYLNDFISKTDFMLLIEGFYGFTSQLRISLREEPTKMFDKPYQTFPETSQIPLIGFYSE